MGWVSGCRRATGDKAAGHQVSPAEGKEQELLSWLPWQPEPSPHQALVRGTRWFHTLPSTCLSSSDTLLAWGATDRNQPPLKATAGLTLPFKFHSVYHGVLCILGLLLEWGSSISITHIQYKLCCQWFHKAWLRSWGNSFSLKLLH